MKLNKIRKLCKAKEVCILYDEFSSEDGALVRQWLSDGVGMWPVSGLPELKESNLGTLLGLNEKQAEKWVLREEEVPEDLRESLGDLESWEAQLKESVISVNAGGRELLPLWDKEGRVLWIDRARLEPCWSEMAVVARRETASGPVAASRPVAAVFEGLFLVGVIRAAVLAEDLRRELRDVGSR